MTGPRTHTDWQTLVTALTDELREKVFNGVTQPRNEYYFYLGDKERILLRQRPVGDFYNIYKSSPGEYSTVFDIEVVWVNRPSHIHIARKYQ